MQPAFKLPADGLTLGRNATWNSVAFPVTDQLRLLLTCMPCHLCLTPSSIEHIELTDMHNSMLVNRGLNHPGGRNSCHLLPFGTDHAYPTTHLAADLHSLTSLAQPSQEPSERALTCLFSEHRSSSVQGTTNWSGSSPCPLSHVPSRLAHLTPNPLFRT